MAVPARALGPLLEDNNSLGARDMGLLPDQLPGYLPLADGATLRGGVGRTSYPKQPGRTTTRCLAAACARSTSWGPIPRATPHQSNWRNCEALDFLVVQDLFLTETAKRATVVLPAVAYTEKDGTFTNTERRVQVVRRAMTELPGARARLADSDGGGERAGPELALRLARAKFWRRSGASCRSTRASRGADWAQAGVRWPLTRGRG